MPAMRLKILLLMLAVFFVTGVEPVMAQVNCAVIESKIKALEAAKLRVQKNLQNAVGEEKQAFLQDIRELEGEIRQAQIDLQRCTGIRMHWTVAGSPRHALVFLPASLITPQHHPLIFAWHGHGGTINKVAQSMHFQTLWPEAIVVYPQGLPTKTANDKTGGGHGWQKELGEDNNRDLKFFDAMLATLREKYSIDDDRIYTTGFSNGTGFSYLLWAERGHMLAAIGAVSGVMAPSERHKSIPPRALISIAGEEGKAPDAVQATVDRAQEINNARGPGQDCSRPDGAPHKTKCRLYQSTTHTPVEQITHPGGHDYLSWEPGAIVEFFKGHKRP